MNKAVFLDRDGVINRLIYHQESGIIDSPFTVSQFETLPGAGEAISRLNQLGYKVVVVTNQPGVAKNHFSLATLSQMHRLMDDQLRAKQAILDAVYFCPHHPEGENLAFRMACQCRKPAPGLLIRAARDLNLDLSHSYMVGDSLTDIQAGQRAGCRAVLIGKMKCDLCHLMDEQGVKPDAIVSNLADAVDTILAKWDSDGVRSPSSSSVRREGRLNASAGRDPLPGVWRCPPDSINHSPKVGGQGVGL